MIYQIEFVGGAHDGEDTFGFHPYYELKFPCGCTYERDIEESPPEWIDDETRRLVLIFSKKEPSEIPCGVT